MANEENLTMKGKARGLTTEEAQIIGRKGGIASGEARHERKLWKEEIVKKLNAKDFDEIIQNLIDRAKNNDKSFEVLRDTMGQKPKEEIETEIKLPVTNITVVDNSELKKKFEEYK